MIVVLIGAIDLFGTFIFLEGDSGAHVMIVATKIEFLIVGLIIFEFEDVFGIGSLFDFVVGAGV